MNNLKFLIVLNDGVSVNITGNDGQTLLRAAACYVHLEVPRDLLSNGCSVHIARKRDLTALMAADVSGHVEVFHELLKHCPCVVIAIQKFSELLKATAVKGRIFFPCDAENGRLYESLIETWLSAFHHSS